jgi:hypothetical protein
MQVSLPQVNVENLRCDGLRLDRLANAVILTTQHICGHLRATTAIGHGSLTTKICLGETARLYLNLVLLTKTLTTNEWELRGVWRLRWGCSRLT